MTDQQQALVASEERPDRADIAVRFHSMPEGQSDVERFDTVVTIPTTFQYRTGNQKAGFSVAITADGYDTMNRALGATFYLPEWVPDEAGDLVRNPIHRPDYIYMRMGAIWRNQLGNLVSLTEDLEVDFKQVHQQARVDSWDSKVMMDENKQPIFDEKGMPRIETDGQDKERAAMQALMSLRTTGLRYAQTVLRVRLLKVATGIRKLPGDTIRPMPVTVVGWRDKMTPQERVEAATGKLDGVFAARPADAPTVSAAEMRNIEGEDPEASVAVHPQDDAVPRPPQNQHSDLTDAERFAEMKAENVVNDEHNANRDNDVANAMSDNDAAEAIAQEYEEMMAAQG